MTYPETTLIPFAFAERSFTALEYADEIIALSTSDDVSPSMRPENDDIATARTLLDFADCIALGRTLEPDLFERLNRIVRSLPVSLRFTQSELPRRLRPVPAATRYLHLELDSGVVDDASGPTFTYNADLVVGIFGLARNAAEAGHSLRRCLQDGTWFYPPPRAGRSKFCRPQCRNRFHYRRSREPQFRCLHCQLLRDLGLFSGLALTDEFVSPASIDSDRILCVECALRLFPTVKAYVEQSGAHVA